MHACVLLRRLMSTLHACCYLSQLYDGSGDLGTVAEGTHSEVKKDVILRLETLTVRETKVGSPTKLLAQDKVI